MSQTPQANFSGIDTLSSAIDGLAAFGHHPDPVIDFCVEVESIEGEWLNIQSGFENGTPGRTELRQRVDRAMGFRAGGDLNAITAKSALRKIDAEMKPHVDGMDELERLAKAATPGPQHIYTFARDDNNWKANSDFHAAASPETVLALISRVRAAAVLSVAAEHVEKSDTTKRLRDEIAKAKRAALKEAAGWHVYHGESMLHVSKSQMAKDHGNASVYVERHNWHMESAAAIRALAVTDLEDEQ